MRNTIAALTYCEPPLGGRYSITAHSNETTRSGRSATSSHARLSRSFSDFCWIAWFGRCLSPYTKVTTKERTATQKMATSHVTVRTSCATTGAPSSGSVLQRIAHHYPAAPRPSRPILARLVLL